MIPTLQGLLDMGFESETAKIALDKYRDWDSIISFLTTGSPVDNRSRPNSALRNPIHTAEERGITPDHHRSNGAPSAKRPKTNSQIDADNNKQRRTNDSRDERNRRNPHKRSVSFESRHDHPNEMDISLNDTNLNRAIEESYRDMKKTDYHYEPVFSKSDLREENTPVGLKNIGNTCYLNSLLQAYFHIPSFRNGILSFNPTQKDWVEMRSKLDIDASYANFFTPLNLIHELQRLFSRMLLTNHRAVDPSDAVNKILADDGTSFRIGNQQDVTEFNHLFWKRLEEGFFRIEDYKIKKEEDKKKLKRIEEIREERRKKKEKEEKKEKRKKEEEKKGKKRWSRKREEEKAMAKGGKRKRKLRRRKKEKKEKKRKRRGKKQKEKKEKEEKEKEGRGKKEKKNKKKKRGKK
eukprot:Anaeramoba_ignava/a350556_27.p1 GENE.a350556_27~~a350556_27.p1  ORF type:complete len:407 (+),score=153.66 a350556_27:23-1243(+)